MPFGSSLRACEPIAAPPPGGRLFGGGPIALVASQGGLMPSKLIKAWRNLLLAALRRCFTRFWAFLGPTRFLWGLSGYPNRQLMCTMVFLPTRCPLPSSQLPKSAPNLATAVSLLHKGLIPHVHADVGVAAILSTATVRPTCQGVAAQPPCGSHGWHPSSPRPESHTDLIDGLICHLRNIVPLAYHPNTSKIKRNV